MAPYLNKPLIRETENKKFIEVIGHYDNPILCAKLTLLAELYAVEHKEGYALFKVEDYDKLAKINDKLEFSVTELAGTTWIIKDNPNVSVSEHGYSVKFTSNGITFNTFWINVTDDDMLGYIEDLPESDVTIVYDGTWTNNNYKTITFSSDTTVDSHNPNLIAWLEANATLVDLTGTTWVLNNTINAPAGYGRFKLNFTSNGNNYNDTNYSFLIGYIPETDTETGAITYGNYIDLAVFDSNTWIDQAYRTISITGGIDAANPQLFNWLSANAIQQVEPTPTGVKNISFGNLPIESISFGSLPVEKVYIGENLVYQAGEPTPSGFDVTIIIDWQEPVSDKWSFTVSEEESPGVFSSILYEDNVHGQATPSPINVHTNTGYINIEVAGSSAAISPISTSSGITKLSWPDGGYSVSSDGTIHIGIYWYLD